MKIAFVVHDYHRSGGHSRYVVELASRFSTRHEVHVFANTFDLDGASRIHFHRVPAWRATALTTILTFAIPAAVCVGTDFDVIHVQGFCGPRGNVVTTHICNESWYRALVRQGDVRWRDRVFHLVTGSLEHWLYKGARNSQVIAISERVARDVAALYECPAPMSVIYHGVDLIHFSPASRDRLREGMRRELQIASEDAVFLFVGNLRKGAAECIRALSKLASGKLVLVSPSDATPYATLARELGCTERVIFIPHTNQVERFYAVADALLLPTPYDSFGLVVTEAMACGLPVIVSREAGASELIRHGENGLLLEKPDDVEELAGHMRSLAGNDCRSARLGTAARRSVEHMSWDEVAVKTMEVYKESTGKRVTQ